MLLFITLFSRYGYALHPYRENRVGAQSAQWSFSEIGRLEVQCQNWRGRRPVRADHRLRTDDDPVRTQSAISDKTRKSAPALAADQHRDLAVDQDFLGFAAQNQAG